MGVITIALSYGPSARGSAMTIIEPNRTMGMQQVPSGFNDDRSGKQASPDWVKSSLSYANGGCVEVATRSGEQIRVRDSKNPGGTVLGFSSADWHTFVGAIRSGKFDRC
jgi:hypothetical protein